MSPQRLDLAENEWASVSSVLGRPLSHSEVGKFEQEILTKSEQIKCSLKLRGVPLASRRYNGEAQLRPSGFSGLLQLLGYDVQVAPKFAVGLSAGSAWQASVLTMLRAVSKRHLSHSPVRSLNIRHASFIDHVAMAYHDALTSALRKDTVLLYREKEDEANFLRGRLSVRRQLKQAFLRPHIIHSDVDTLDSNNPINRLFAWAAHRLQTMSTDPLVRESLRRLSHRLPVANYPSHIPRFVPRLPPQYSSYSEALEIALQLMQGMAHGQEMGGRAGYGYLINMEGLFERFIEHSLSNAIACTAGLISGIKPQDTRVYAVSMSGGRDYFVRPDNVLYKGAQPVLLVDAKYKRLSDSDNEAWGKPLNEDIYQLFASLHAHGCKRGLLVYPRIISDHQLNDGRPRYWRLSFGQEPHIIAAVSVDLTNLDSVSRLRDFYRAFAGTVTEVVLKS